MPTTDLVPITEYRALSTGVDAAQRIKDALGGEEVSPFDLTQVRIPTGGASIFEIPSKIGESKAEKRLEGVILFATSSRAYWDKKYSGGSEPPTCSSPDGETAEPRADETGATATIPAQKDPDTGRLLCHTCKLGGPDAWGTAINEKGEPTRGKACREMRQVFLLTPSKLLPVLLTLPPTSIQPWRGYLLGLADEEMSWQDIVTEVTLQKVTGKGPDYSQAVFRPGTPLPDAEREQIAAYRAASEPVFLRVARQTFVDQAREQEFGAPAEEPPGHDPGSGDSDEGDR